MTPSIHDPIVVLPLPCRRRTLLGGTAVAIALPWLASCGGGAGEAALFAPFFVFAFQGVLERRIVNVSFTPDAASSGKSAGRFDPDNSFVNVRNGSSLSFDGSFDQRDLEIMLASLEPPLARSYRGRFTSDDAVHLTPVGAASGAFTVRRNRNDSFLPTLTGEWVGTDTGAVPWSMRLETEPANSDTDATVLLVGSETRAGTDAALLGYANIRYIELEVQRPTGLVRLVGSLDPSATAPPAGEPQVTQTIRFEGGGSLQRA